MKDLTRIKPTNQNEEPAYEQQNDVIKHNTPDTLISKVFLPLLVWNSVAIF